ncbi:MAG: hypothetical protein AB8G11_22285 [Saprospiraceae bacterium]
MFEKISIENIKQYTKDFMNSERAILLLCISIALIFWFIIQLSKSQEIVIDAKLNIKTPKGLTLKNEPPKTLKIQLVSKGWNLFSTPYRKQLRRITLSIDKDKTYNYRQLQQVLKSSISDKIDVTSISPNTLSFELDEYVRKKIPVKAIALVETVNQFQLSNKIQLLPDSIEIYGPKSLIAPITFVNTKEIRAKNLKENRYGEIELLLQKNKQVKYQVSIVNYIMTVEQFSEKTLNVPIIVENDTTNSIRLIPQMATITCSVGLTKYDKLNPSDIQLSVNAYNVDLKEITKLPVITKKKPNWISNIKINPEYVDFVILTTTENITKNGEE